VDPGLQPGPLYTRARGEKAYLINPPRLLRPRAERPRGGRGAQKYDECTALHSLTSSAIVFLPLRSIVSSGPSNSASSNAERRLDRTSPCNGTS
jgi:hypothetical protein